MKMKRLLAVATLLTCSQSYATEKMYGTLGVNYSDTEFSVQESDGVGYSLAVGHQFAPQWYVEAGYMKLVDELDESGGLDADALYLAILGKASGRQGELFYKLGIAKTDIQGREAAKESGDCRLGAVQGPLCSYDEGIAAGMVGLGYDYNIGLRSMLRFEYTYFLGEDDFEAHVATLGFRYNFN